MKLEDVMFGRFPPWTPEEEAEANSYFDTIERRMAEAFKPVTDEQILGDIRRLLLAGLAQ